MELQDKRERLLALAALGAVATLLLARLSAFGIWDPWELTSADLARRLLAGDDPTLPHAGPLLVSAGFSLLGVDEWSGRLPIALCGVVTALLTYLLVARFAGRRAGVYAVLVVGTSPLVVFNSRAMLGDAPAFAVQAAIALCACGVVLPGPRGARWAWLAGCLGLTALAVLMRGALLAALPPLAAATAVFALQRGEGEARPRPLLPALALGGVCLALTVLIAHDVAADRAQVSPWLGGQPVGGTPPSFDSVVGRVFHGFAPWSALLPLAIAHVVTSRAPARGAPAAEAGLRMFLLLWAAAGYAAQTLFVSRYGDNVAFLPVAALAGVVGLFLHDLERSEGGQWAAGLAAALLSLLLMRDYALYPESPVRGMPLDDFSVPEVFNPKRSWSLLLGLFGGFALLALAARRPEDASRRPSLAAPYRFLAAQFRRGWPERLWLLAAGILLLALLVLGALAFASPQALGLTTLGQKWLRRLMFAPLALPLLAVAWQLLWFGYTRFHRFRMLPLVLCGLAVGGYAAQGFMPALSAHFSPREVYDTYNALARPGEVLGEYQVGGRAAAYYAEGEVVDLENQHQLLEHLSVEERRWAALPAEELPKIDRLFRRRTERHLFVADARSARVVLVSNQPIEGRRNESFLAQDVLSEVPPIEHEVYARFEDEIEFLGYDLALPHGDYVGAGEQFDVTWYFRSLSASPGSWRVFVHIDGQGKRIHGDHEPLDGKYPVRLWDKGDVVVDRQRLEVPNSYPAGTYTIYLGFYQGERRLKVSEGPNDGADRVIAGVLRIR